MCARHFGAIRVAGPTKINVTVSLELNFCLCADGMHMYALTV